MRSSEDMAYAMYLADHKALHHAQHPSVSMQFEHPLTWDELTEEEQNTYLRHVNAMFEHLFEHGRISSYLSGKNLEELRQEYMAYLEREMSK